MLPQITPQIDSVITYLLFVHNPPINHIRPILQYFPALLDVLRLVVNRPNAALFVGKAFSI